jgi:hypothetical protein
MSSEERTATGASNVLTSAERAACQKIAGADAGVTSQRAAALLAVADGATRVQASVQSGLTPGQVGYAVTLFRRKGLAMFPDLLEVEPPEETAQPKKKAKKKGKDKKKPKKGKKNKPKKGKGKGKKKK